MKTVIKEFRDEFSFLSNFYPVKIAYGSCTFDSVEAAFQAIKSKDWTVRKQFEGLSPSAAKALGRRIALREDWKDIRLKVMEYLVREKFKNEFLREKLLSTGDAVLVEGNYWNDKFWGVDLRTNQGENHLGKILMKVREETKQ